MILNDGKFEIAEHIAQRSNEVARWRARVGAWERRERIPHVVCHTYVLAKVA